MAEHCEHHQSAYCNECRPGQIYTAEVAKLKAAVAHERAERQRVEGERDDLHATVLEVIGERDAREDQLEAACVAIGCEQEWSNLHDHGLELGDRVDALRAQLAVAREVLTDIRNNEVSGSTLWMITNRALERLK